MRGYVLKSLGLMMLLWLPMLTAVQTVLAADVPPQIAQPLIREGDFALKLSLALSLGTPANETEAEKLLSEVNIIPKNGWLADYPITPDIAAELSNAVQDAAVSGKISLRVEEALQKFDSVLAQSNLPITLAPTDASNPLEPQEDTNSPVAQVTTPNYHSQTVIENYYQSTGPPIVTYYAPPPAYYSLYGWVPFGFWSAGFWFPGFFVLNNFHQAQFFGNQHFFVSNHFRDTFYGRTFRVNAVDRFHGRAFFDGTRTNSSREFIGVGRGRSNSVSTFQAPRGSREFSGAARSRGGEAFFGSRTGRGLNTPSIGATQRSMGARSGHSGGISREISLTSNSGRGSMPAPSGRSFSAPSNSGRGVSMPSRMGGASQSFSHGGGGFSGGSRSGGSGRSGGGGGRGSH